MNYRDINVWILVNHLFLPLPVAGTVTQYFIKAMNISKSVPNGYPIIALHGTVEHYLGVSTQIWFGQLDPLRLNMVHGLLPWRIFILPAGRQQLRYLLTEIKNRDAWTQISVALDCETDDRYFADEDVAKYWNIGMFTSNDSMYAHVEIGKITRIVKFNF